jgi:SAM-dependent methyltransferase
MFDVTDPRQLDELASLRIKHPPAEQLINMDPFSAEYRSAALSIYEDLKGARGYAPEQDEKSLEHDFDRLFTGMPPWVVQDTKYLSEFLYSWAQISRLLDVKGGQTVLEYGPGAGEILLTLARVGVEVYGVDLAPAWLDTIQKRAEVMGVSVHLELAQFGEGFEGLKFDRILFFEAFHHAFDFLDLLDALKKRLNLGGFIVFCGEPILGAMTDSVPYPWGPRLDGLSVYAIRRNGWMELGFAHEFFVSALCRAGYDVAFHPSLDCGRACAYTATPGTGVYSDPATPQLFKPAPAPSRSLLAKLFGRR